jgi:RNA polymerase sigma-70 factor (ECF subfamily)
MPVRSYSHGEDADETNARIDSIALRAALQDALADLPDDQREALTLRVLEGRSYDEIAAALHVAEPTVRKRVSRALGTLNARFRGARA